MADESAVLEALASELVVAVDVDRWVVVDSWARDLVERIGLGPVSVIGQASEPHARQVVDRPFADRERILFSGAVPNAYGSAMDGLEWILSEVLPQAPALAGVKVTIVGEWDAATAAGFARRFGDRVEMIGAVDDHRLAEIYGQTRVALAPDRVSANRFASVAEAVLAGVPCVMTDIVADRLGAADDAALASVPRDDHGRRFAEWLGRLYTQERTWRAQLKKQRAIVPTSDMADQVKAVLDSLGSGD